MAVAVNCFAFSDVTKSKLSGGQPASNKVSTMKPITEEDLRTKHIAEIYDMMERRYETCVLLTVAVAAHACDGGLLPSARIGSGYIA